MDVISPDEVGNYATFIPKLFQNPVCVKADSNALTGAVSASPPGHRGGGPGRKKEFFTSLFAITLAIPRVLTTPKVTDNP